MRHYLEPSIRAPKRFVATPPPSEDWAECLLKIRRVGDLCGLIGNGPGEALAKALWRRDGDGRPDSCCAVVELEIELLTGRTHQIRGQLAAAGFPIAGDAQYGGAVPHDAYPPAEWVDDHDDNQRDRLALQCSELEFLDPDIIRKEDGTVSMKPSKRWNQFRLGSAWWSTLIEEFRERTGQLSAKDATTLASDIGLMGSTPTTAAKVDTGAPAKPHLLPPRVKLSPGANKYVLARATHTNDDEVHWFVKSAAPAECGGPYHGNVAQDLREWIEAAGYEVKVTGGGRIDYRPDEARAVVYGFSYGFGRGDHARAAAVIREWSKGGIAASFDDSPDLY